jgi:hypothetical protein
MSRSLLVIVVLVGVPSGLLGCGPLLLPAGNRLPDDAQWETDVAWEQAMTAPHWLGREELLRFVVSNLGHVMGVDRFKYRSEKDLSGGKVIMMVDFDRALPGDGVFTLEYRNLAGTALRVERYAGEEVIELAKRLTEEEIEDARANGVVVMPGPWR